MKRLRFLSVLICVIIAQMIPTKAMADDYELGDLNHDGSVDVADVVSLINRVLSGHWSGEQQDDHEWVDLGLPSGTLWATCNVGANAPEEYGDYFAWGETEPKDVYDWSTYKWCNGTYNTLTKYCTSSKYGTVDGKTELLPVDDAAYVNWGQSWRMPIKSQCDELLANCIWTWTSINGVNGRLVTGPNGNTMFMPAAGCRSGNDFVDVNALGEYWASTLASGASIVACLFSFGSNGMNDVALFNDRIYGRTVRAVRVSQN